ncbi:MAG: serine hydroxymethyltransferase [Bordetella sp.]|nr:MAG: serine hydroxymethyltransferase [Bordetella sp.]
MPCLSQVDPDVWNSIQKENVRQEEHIELIASENYASLAVMEAQGSQLTNKYAEGYPGNRYYGGCQYVDLVEKIAINRLKEIFGSETANVQPHSGSQANQGVYMAILNPGDTVLGMSLNAGGHLTHGSPVNSSGLLYNFIPYGLDKNEIIDYNQIEILAKIYQPRLIVAGASSYSLHIDFERIASIAKKNNSLLMVDIAHYAGLIAGKVYPNPVPYADFITSTTHKSLRGPRGGFIMMKSIFEKSVNSAIFPGIQGGPLMHTIAAKAVAFKEALSTKFQIYTKQVVRNAKALANVLAKRGFRIVSGGTDSHLFLVDLRQKGITGKEAELALGKAKITVNKNSIPNDPEKPLITSGIRIGTLAITTRGFMENESKIIANLIADILEYPFDENNIKSVIERVDRLTQEFPVYNVKC